MKRRAKLIPALLSTWVFGLIFGAVGLPAADPYPKLVTAETRGDVEKLSALERPGKVFFRDGFESPESAKKYFEIRGLREGRAKLTTNAELAHKRGPSQRRAGGLDRR